MTPFVERIRTARMAMSCGGYGSVNEVNQYGGHDTKPLSDDYGGAHADGFDSADYMADDYKWASLVLEAFGTPTEGWLFLAAARDYAEHCQRCEDADEQPLPRGKWCEAHVAGQADRAMEIVDPKGKWF